jgi:anaerobic ribonucleoside-triphosphate reductase
MGEIAEVTLNLAAIESINAGANEKALEQLDRQIQISKIFLEGCANDLCRNGNYPKVENTLKLISKYEQSKQP